mmetsp:Transcript_5944/g.18388  ORF Transcript_5944/g.18388 Transcript_5944/m.18388 type:complete len:250 (-) Transcript_5944:757-1506(-)
MCASASARRLAIATPPQGCSGAWWLSHPNTFKKSSWAFVTDRAQTQRNGGHATKRQREGCRQAEANQAEAAKPHEEARRQGRARPEPALRAAAGSLCRMRRAARARRRRVPQLYIERHARKARVAGGRGGAADGRRTHLLPQRPDAGRRRVGRCARAALRREHLPRMDAAPLQHSGPRAAPGPRAAFARRRDSGRHRARRTHRRIRRRGLLQGHIRRVPRASGDAPWRDLPVCSRKEELQGQRLRLRRS